MTHVLSRMLNDPMTRAALNAGGDDAMNTENAASVATNQENQDTEMPASGDDTLNNTANIVIVTSHDSVEQSMDCLSEETPSTSLESSVESNNQSDLPTVDGVVCSATQEPPSEEYVHIFLFIHLN